MSYTPFPSGAKSSTLDVMFTERLRQLEGRGQAALRLLSSSQKQLVRNQLFASPLELFTRKGCLLNQTDCLGFAPVSDWSNFPIPSAEICECKKIAGLLRQHFACYFIDVLEREGLGSTPLTLPRVSWVQVGSIPEGHAAALRVACALLLKSGVLEELNNLSPSAKNILTAHFIFRSPTHALVDWTDFLAGIYKPSAHNKPSAASFLEQLCPGQMVVMHFGDYRFRLKNSSQADVAVLDRLVTELDNRSCALIAISQQDLAPSVKTSALNVDYRVDSREFFVDQQNKTRFTSTKRKTTEALALLDVLPPSAADRLLALLAAGQKALHV